MRGYDLDGRLIGQSLGGADRTLAYDLVGNITGLTTGAETERFDYDPLDRLIGAVDPVYSLAWSYDANGNRLSETQNGVVIPYTIEELSNRLLAVADIQRSYDANGNTLSDGDHSYSYDARNRLVAVDEGQTGQYRHNAIGQRVYKEGKAVPGDADGDGRITTGDLHAVKDGAPIDCDGPGKGKGRGQTTACVANQIGDYANNGRGVENGSGRGVQETAQQGTRKLLFAYDEGGQLLGEYRLDGTAEQETVWLGNLPVATVRSGVAYAVHADHLGTPRVITDALSREVWRWESDPFGVALPEEDPDGDGVRVAYNLRFPGQYFDEETGLHYNWFRDYEPGVGRYVESDPIGLGGGMNGYLYGAGSPALNIDPIGLVAWGGTMHSRAFIRGVGAGYIEFKLESSCAENKKAIIEVLAVGPGVGMGFDVSETRADIAFEDYLDHVDPSVFNGGFGVFSVGVILGQLGDQRGKIRLGDAFSTGSGDTKGLDIGVVFQLGSSNVMNADWESCACE